MRYFLPIILILFKTIQACTCGQVGFVGRYINSDYIFKGKVISINTGELNKYNGIPIYNEFIFSMDKCWKGAYNDTISVKAGDYRMDSCGTDFELGETYLVFTSLSSWFESQVQGDLKNESLVTTVCSGNKKLNETWYWDGAIMELDKIIKLIKENPGLPLRTPRNAYETMRYFLIKQKYFDLKYINHLKKESITIKETDHFWFYILDSQNIPSDTSKVLIIVEKREGGKVQGIRF